MNTPKKPFGAVSCVDFEGFTLSCDPDFTDCSGGPGRAFAGPVRLSDAARLDGAGRRLGGRAVGAVAAGRAGRRIPANQ